MAVKDRANIRRLTGALLTGVAVCAMSLPAPVVHAQSLSAPASGSVATPEDAKLLLAANELLYDRDAERVVASGAVQINYNGYQMVARQVVYDQKTGRVTAAGNIELVEPGGNRVYAIRSTSPTISPTASCARCASKRPTTRASSPKRQSASVERR